MDLKPYITTPDAAEKIADWLRTRGGIAIWQLAGTAPGATLTTPLNTSAGDPVPQPVWSVGDQPVGIITDPADVIISDDREVKRFHATVRRRSDRYTTKSSRRIRTALDRAGKGAYCLFDDNTQEVVIMKPELQVPLLDWLASHASALIPETEKDTIDIDAWNRAQNRL